MPLRFRWTAAAGLVLTCAMHAGRAAAQVGMCPHGHVVDTGGAPVDGATVTRRAAALGAPVEETVTTGRDGAFAFRCASGSSAGVLRATGTGLESSATPVADGDAVLMLHPTAIAQQIQVTATRGSIALGAQAETVVALSGPELSQFPALTLDESLRQHAGFELFRRSSSWVANPTSQGISLRGLGSTAASRTLVLLDQAPLNDPFGGWIHWNETPPESIAAVTIATGGGSDLYGSSALGGVIDVIPVRPAEAAASASVSGASEDTTDEHGQLGLRQGRWTELLAGQGFRTAGYIPTAPASRGPVDQPANVHFQNGRVELDRSLGSGRAFLAGNLLNEARDNGTPVQMNATRLWRWMAGDDWSAGQRSSGRARLFGSNEGYRQSFSAIDAARDRETLTRLQHVRTGEAGGSADAEVRWSRVAAIFGADARDIRATDLEQPISHGAATSTLDTSARQRFLGGFGEVLAVRNRWSGALSLRVDDARNLDTRTLALTSTGAATVTPIGNRAEVVLSPRIGLVRSLPRGFELHAATFRAFRTPTLNELYRTGQVGQEITQANAQLRSERATGAEGGVAWRPSRGPVSVHANYFWTAINRPVSAVLISSTATVITNLRENLGQLVSQGVETEVRVGEGRRLSGAFGYQYAHATVTSFAAEPALVGRWIPEVPRHSVTAQLRATDPRWGTLVLSERASGQAFDDSSNIYPLRRFAELDLFGEHVFRRGVSLFAAAQNVFNQRADVARTPVLTLGTPLLIQGGVRYTWPRSAR